MEPFTDGPWPCTYSHTISPSEFDVEVGVQRSFLGDEFEIKPSTAGSATFVYTKRCGPGMPSGTGASPPTPYNALALFRGASGGLRVRSQDGASNETEHREAGFVYKDGIVIHRARQ